MTRKFKIAILGAVLVIGAVTIGRFAGSRPAPNTINYSQFVERVREGQVARIEIAAGNPGASPATIHLKDGHSAQTILRLDYSAALALLQEKLVNVEIQDTSTSPMRLLLNATPFLVLLAVWVILMLNRRSFLHWRG
jgi:cell division protease FtsH